MAIFRRFVLACFFLQGLPFSAGAAWFSRCCVALCIIVVLSASMYLEAYGANSDDSKNENFSFETRLYYDSALVNGVKSLNVLIAAKMGRTEEAVRTFTGLGGKVIEQFDAVGYFWGSIPTRQLPKLLAVPDIVLFQLDGVAGTRVEYNKPLDPRTLEQGSVWRRVSLPARPKDSFDPYCATCPARPDPSVAEMPLLPRDKLQEDNLFLPWYLMDVPEFLKQHPTFDGRGTTIAVVEGYGDLLHPALQEALTLDGKPIAKIVGILDTTPPPGKDAVYNGLAGTEYPPSPFAPTMLTLHMTEELDSQTSTAVFRGETLSLPRPGKYKIGLLQNDGRTFRVLWSPASGSVWVDTNQNASFADEVELKDINRHFSAARLPGEDGPPGASLAVPVSFAVTIDKAHSNIRIFLQQDDHATGVATIAAGNGLFGGNANGIAPGARILYVDTGEPLSYTSYHQNLRAFILTASRPDVDVVTSSFVVKPPIDGETVTALILDRLAEVYQKPMFFLDLPNISENYGLTSDMAAGTHVFSTRGYTTADIWHTFYGVDAPARDNSPDGGIEISINGALKPDFLAPYYTLAGGNCFSLTEYDVRNSSVAGYRLPPCYTIFAGTSATAPSAAGIAALLISAAKQTGTPHNLERLAWALRTGSTYLDQMPSPVSYQGNGLPNVLTSWNLLSSTRPTPSFEISSVSNGALENYRKTPHRSIGINEYWGWHPGSRETRTITIRRLSGPASATHYRLTWRGNDGTFSAPSTIDLPLKQPIPVPVAIAPTTVGVHQGIVQIADSTDGTVLARVMNTVVAAQPLGEHAPVTNWQPAPIATAQQACNIFDVQPGVAAIEAHYILPQGAAIMQIGSSPLLGPDWYLRRAFDSPEPHATVFREPGDRTTLFSHPPPGPWVFCAINNHGGNNPMGNSLSYIQPKIAISALMAHLHVDLAPSSFSKAIGAPVEGSVRIDNQGATLKSAALQVRIGYVETHTIHIGSLGQTAEVDIDVADNTQLLLPAVLNGPSNQESYMQMLCSAGKYCHNLPKEQNKSECTIH